MDDSAISSSPTLHPPADADAPAAATPRSLRLWFGIYLAWMIGLFTVAALMSARYETGGASAMALWLLALMAFYVSLCNTLLPLPTAWIILLAASDDIMLFESHLLRIAAVSLLGATATMMASLNEYHVFGYLLSARLGQRLRRTHVYRWAARWFDLSPFQTLTLVAFIPIPVDVVRWLAILRRYSRLRFAAAYWLGRLPRYALLAGLAVLLKLGLWEIILIQIAFVAILGARLFRTMLARAQADAKTV